jgi:predicted AAA+ superfamily ATPase
MVKSILDSCIPRDDILKGTFNPEIFTASLGAVIKGYLEAGSGLHSVYSNAENFFRNATYPSQGLRTVVQEVFLRLSGNNTVPAIHRLETGFGGGKTHTLTACTHIGFRGNEFRKALKLPVSCLRCWMGFPENATGSVLADRNT